MGDILTVRRPGSSANAEERSATARYQRDGDQRDHPQRHQLSTITVTSLDGLTALVTGGGTGIGRGIAAALLERGCTVAIAGRRAEVVEATASELNEGGERVVAVSGDVSDPEAARAVIERTVEALGTIHLLVNNAGVAFRGPLESTPPASVHSLIDIDLKGPIFVTQAALPHLRSHRAERNAAIVNISSSVTHRPLRDYAVYSAAKAGVEMLTRCLALELAPDRIRVNAIAPGVVDTPIFRQMMSSDAARERLRQLTAQVPLGRLGRPADVGRLAAQLCAPSNDWLTGAVIPLDGGHSLGRRD